MRDFYESFDYDKQNKLRLVEIPAYAGITTDAQCNSKFTLL